MARKEIYKRVLKTPYSRWHRQQHNGIAYTDIDKVAQCPACGKALFIADLIFNKDDSYKTKVFYTKRAYFEISKALNIAYFEIHYTTVGRQDNGDLERLSVRRIAPNEGSLHHISLDNWLKYLEFKVIEHIPVCQSKNTYSKELQKKTTNKNFYEK